jgi:hypothetical protein
VTRLFHRHTQRRRPRRGTGSGVGREEVEDRLLRDVVAALPGGVLRGFDLLPALAPQDADEAPNGMLRKPFSTASGRPPVSKRIRRPSTSTTAEKPHSPMPEPRRFGGRRRTNSRHSDNWSLFRPSKELDRQYDPQLRRSELRVDSAPHAQFHTRLPAAIPRTFQPRGDQPLLVRFRLLHK